MGQCKKQDELFQKLPFGFSVLTQNKINKFNEHFHKTLGFKTNSHLITILKKIKRRNMPNVPNVRQPEVSFEMQKPLSLFSDIFNISRNNKQGDINEEIEYDWERIDPKTKLKFHRFFIITSKFIFLLQIL